MKESFKKIFLSLTSFVFFFLLVEYIYSYGFRTTELAPNLFEWHADYGYTLRNNLHSEWVVPQSIRYKTVGKFIFQTNNFHLRHNNPSSFKELTKPILVVGDSYTMGAYVNEGDHFVEQLRRATGYPFVYFGVPLSGAERAYRYMLSDGLRFHPDEIWFIEFTGNDILDDYYGADHYVERNGTIFARKHEFKITIALMHSNLIKDLLIYLKSRSIPPPHSEQNDLDIKPPDWHKDPQYPMLVNTFDPKYQAAIETHISWIVKMDNLCRRKGLKFKVISIPFPAQIHRFLVVRKIRHPFLLQESIASSLKSRQIPYFSSHNFIYTYAIRHPNQDLYDKPNGHFNTLGYKVFARYILRDVWCKRAAGPRALAYQHDW